jgi:hypothetical protein
MTPTNAKLHTTAMLLLYHLCRVAMPPREAGNPLGPGKPEHRAMPTRFFHNVLILRFWQAQLLDALVKVK